VIRKSNKNNRLNILRGPTGFNSVS
jgi:hypothetical protein